MRSRGQVLSFIAAFILLMLAGPGGLLAADIQLIVNNATNAECSNTATPACFPSIQEAINYANNLFTANTGTTFSIFVETGTYGEAITLKSGVTTIQGRETARTILTGSGSAPVVTANNLSAEISFRNFSIINAASGILVSNNSSAINITNNVFYNVSGTAVTIQGTALTKVINNTFYRNGTAVVRDSASDQITNNIFSNNTVHISGASFPTNQSNITYNDFFNPTPALGVITDPQSIPNQFLGNPDPLFADILDISRLDFHLQPLSPCINNGDPSITDSIDGSRSDMGAYGGPNADTIPMQVSNVIATPSTTSISLTWNANLSYEVAGYRVWYGRTSVTSGGLYDGTGAAEGASPINVSTITAATLSGLTTTVSTPANPLLNKPTALNESLILSWNAVPGATKYRVYYGTSSPPNTPVDVGNATTYKLSGLTNGQTYFVAVSAIAEPINYIAITAFDSTGQTRTAAIIPGINHESAYSQEVSASFGSAAESGLSNIESDFPEALVAYPNLRNSRRGCFIATAAYGCYSAPEVQALRAFRDRYLLTNSEGSAFVRWYYEHGPVAAAWLEAHPGYKPLVRTALMPAVGLALFMTGTSLFIKAVVALLMLIIALMLANSFFRKRLSGSGGA